MLMLYFSGTGNSKYIAELFAENMGCPCHSIEETVDFAGLIKDSDLVGFCYPIYGSRPPRNMREFVTEYKDLLNGKRLIIFCTQMLGSGDGSRCLTDLLAGIQYDVLYAEHFLMPNNVNNLFFLPITSKGHNEKCYRKARAKMDEVCENIRKGKVVKRGFCIGSKWLGLFQGTFMPAIENRYKNSVRVNQSKCTRCGLCVKNCPVHNLAMEDQSVTTNGNCILCYRCTNGCPVLAITVGFKADPKKQYLFEAKAGGAGTNE